MDLRLHPCSVAPAEDHEKCGPNRPTAESSCNNALYHRFGVSFRDVEDLLAQRGITVSYEAIRLWCLTFGSAYARRLKRRQGRLGETWYLDEVFVTIQGRRHYLWRAVDQDGDVIDILVQSRRDCRAATRFFRKLLKGPERQPGRLVTDKLSSYRAAHRTVMPSVAHRTDRYENNRAEVSHQPTRQRERHMRRVQISRSGTTLLVRARTRPQPFPRWPSPGASGASSRAPRSLFPHLGCSHNRRLTRVEITIPSTGSLDERELDNTRAARYFARRRSPQESWHRSRWSCPSRARRSPAPAGSR